MSIWGTPPPEISFDDLPNILENGGVKEVSVTGLSGLLADDQHVLDAEVKLVFATIVSFEDTVVLFEDNVVYN